ncbi:hypothetical protein ACFO7V_18310 [Glutamicibacter bergerei]|uniref:Secreted protein n=1 Tax=Glutamicibacter bergerei TaxID=256702 RepID=A0ABV9MQ41_9MICC|nr:hypothetical protein [Micrococcaceae bacterium]
MIKKSIAGISVLSLAGLLLVATPSGALAAPNAHEGVSIPNPPAITLPVQGLESDHFQDCPNVTTPPPIKSDLGDELGAGITEKMTSESLKALNDSRIKQGEKALSADVEALRYFESGKIVALDSSGNIIAEISSADSRTSKVSQVASASSEAKRIIKACLGVGINGGLTFENIVQMFNTPAKAAKFVVRRIGIIGAISCVGGVIWEYI